jgi:hypothetical protein
MYVFVLIKPNAIKNIIQDKNKNKETQYKTVSSINVI